MKNLKRSTAIPAFLYLLNFFKTHTIHLIFVHFGSWFYQNIPRTRKKLITLGKKQGINVHVWHNAMIMNTKNLE